MRRRNFVFHRNAPDAGRRPCLSCACTRHLNRAVYWGERGVMRVQVALALTGPDRVPD